MKRLGAFATMGVGVLATAVLSPTGPVRAVGGGQGGCVAHHPAYVEDVFEVHYSSGCSGHDEPELMPVSNAPGSAQNLTWTFELPSNGPGVDVDAVGPTFWFGGPVDDSNSLFGQAYEELQFYPNAVVTTCGPNGGFVAKHRVGSWTVCSPTWSIHTTGQKPVFHEPAAFNAMLSEAGSSDAMVMHQGDQISVHFFVTAAKDGWHITVLDHDTGRQGTIVLDSKRDGPLMPAYSVQRIGNSLLWGAVHDAPAAFVWEIGHTSPFTSPSDAFCWPGEAGCYSYDEAAWAGQSPPIHIDSVTFRGGAAPTGWSVVSDYGGKAEVTDPSETGSTCSSYGGPFCIYPWFTRNQDGSFSYGVDYPTTADDFGKADQFQQTTACGGPFGPHSTYCSTPVG
ncbi:MAG: hypothetical protein J2P22_04445 [Nocardioides sp.]|nr:hypothetical protein [Nocardioides sp.]